MNLTFTEHDRLEYKIQCGEESFEEFKSSFESFTSEKQNEFLTKNGPTSKLTLIAYAARSQNSKVIEYLFEKGAKFNIEMREFERCLFSTNTLSTSNIEKIDHEKFTRTIEVLARLNAPISANQIEIFISKVLPQIPFAKKEVSKNKTKMVSLTSNELKTTNEEIVDLMINEEVKIENLRRLVRVDGDLYNYCKTKIESFSQRV